MWTERHLVLQVMPASTQADEIAGHPLPSPDDAEEPMRTNLTPLSPAEEAPEEAAGKHCSAPLAFSSDAGHQSLLSPSLQH